MPPHRLTSAFKFRPFSQHKILYNFESPVRAITHSQDKKNLVIGCESGILSIISLDLTYNEELIEPKFNKYNRIWNAIWPENDNFIMSGSYGVLKQFNRDRRGNWNYDSFSGHNHSIFGLDGLEGIYFVSGDYRGNIIIWEYKENEYINVQELGVGENVQDISWCYDQCFVTLTRFGKINLFEKESANVSRWINVFDLNVASGIGYSIHITNDAKTIFASTQNEVIQFDRDSQLTNSFEINGVKKIFSAGSDVFLLKNEGLYVFQKKDIVISDEIISYKFVKISVLGHTQTGKSSFCEH